MYRNSYSEVLENAPQTTRAHERAAILQSIRLLDRAEAAGVNSPEAAEALFFVRQLWEFFLGNLADTENQLPEKLRADIISIGISLLNEAEKVKRGEVKSFASMKEISQSIATGLL